MCESIAQLRKNLARLEGDINSKEMQRAQTLEELAAQDVEIEQIKRSIADSEQSLKKQDVTFFPSDFNGTTHFTA